MLKRGHLFLIIRIAVSISAICILLFVMREEMGKIFSLIVNLKKTFFIVSFILFILISILVSLRFKLLLKVQDISLSLIEVTRLTFIGYFFNNFFPSSIGGDLAKGYYASKSTNKKLSSFTTVFVDRLIGITSLVFFMFTAIVFIKDARDDRIALSLAGVVIFLVSFMMVFLFNRDFARRFSFILKFLGPFKLNEKLKKIYESINSYKNYRRILLKAFLVSFLIQILIVLIFLMLGKSIDKNLQIGFKDLFWVVPLSAVISMLPSINGIGVREGAFVYFLRRIISPEVAFSISLLYLGLTIIISLIGGVIYISMKNHKTII
ncbi:MAG: flippase-like domain-containing protein [Candidatus Omnitrophica bacterium]|nr:flippase-like domain-containing protein [Candidatus Omnitrophota bacterium]